MTTQQQETTEVERTPQFGEAGFKPAAHADDEELARLEAEMAKEEAGEASTGDQAAEGEAELTTEIGDQGEEETHEEARPETAAQPQAPSKTIMIPKQRLDEALRDRDQLLQRLARLEGAVTVMAAGKVPEQGEQPKPEPTPQERIDGLKADIDTLAEKFESGEISTRDFARQQLALQEAIFDIKQELRAPSAAAPAQDSYLDEQLKQLPQEFAVLKEITAAEVEAIVPRAMKFAEENNIDVSTTVALRRHIASFAHDFYSRALGRTNTTAAGGKPPGQQADPNRVEQGRQKLRQAQSAPPNLNTHAVNYSGSSGGVPTPEQFASMTEDQRAALPDAVLAKMAG